MKKIFYAAFAVAVIVGCSSSWITSSWQAPDAQPRAYQKIMVVGIIREADRTIRERMEDHLVGDLKDLGYNAVPAYREYGPKAFEKMEEKEVLQKLKSEGVDAVMTIVMLDKQQERYYTPNRVVLTPYVTYHRRFWGYYTTIYDRIESPGYYQLTTHYFWESNFFDLNTGKLLASVQTQTFDPSSFEQMGHEYGQLIVNQMKKEGILSMQIKATSIKPM